MVKGDQIAEFLVQNAFVPIEDEGWKVEEIRMHPLDYATLRKNGRIILIRK